MKEPITIRVDVDPRAAEEARRELRQALARINRAAQHFDARYHRARRAARQWAGVQLAAALIAGAVLTIGARLAGYEHPVFWLCLVFAVACAAWLMGWSGDQGRRYVERKGKTP